MGLQLFIKKSSWLGKKVLQFDADVDFERWKEKEEEAFYTTFVNCEKTYPVKNGKKCCVIVVCLSYILQSDNT